MLLIGCGSPKKEVEDFTNVPYPANEDIIYYQSECDSGYQAFWSDIRMATSAYLNNSKYAKFDISGDDIVIIGEGLFIGQTEVETPDFILEIKLIRPNKSRGRRSIWQVVEVEEKPWPTKDSKSNR
jgi:hypothetical protein